MFDNIGEKIKALAAVICIVGMISFVILGVTLFDTSFWLALLTIVAGCLGSWTGSFCLYGFGELIEETTLNRIASEKIMKLLEQSENKEASKVQKTMYDIKLGATTSAGDGAWTCKNCGTENGRLAVFCRNCGTYK